MAALTTKAGEDGDSFAVDQDVARVECAGDTLGNEEAETLSHVESEFVAFRPLDGIKVVVNELAQGAVAGLLKEQGGDLSCCGGSVGEVAVELDDLSALAKLVQRLNLIESERIPLFDEKENRGWVG